MRDKEIDNKRLLASCTGMLCCQATSVETRSGHAWFTRIALACLLLVLNTAAAVAQNGWIGKWRTFSPDSTWLLTLEDQGDGTIVGLYYPGGGALRGRLENGLLRGTVQIGGSSRGVVAALSDDGQSFTGRYETGVYWNGVRTEAETTAFVPIARTTPEMALRSLMVSVNLVADRGDVAALNRLDEMLVYEGGFTDNVERAFRRKLLWELVELSTFKVRDVPDNETAGEVIFPIGPVSASVRYQLRIRQDASGWRIVVEDEPKLEAALALFLEEIGHPTVESARKASRNSPRGVMRRFLKGTNAWHDGGREAVPETVDLSFLPSHVQSVQGPILVDYLNRILDRTNYLVSQEIPNDPQQPTPYVHYRHAAGDVVIEPVPGDGEIPERWLFSASTLESAPSLFAAIEALPVAEGVTPDPPLTPFFRLRETVRAYAPGLLSRALFLEAWQWLSLALWITVSTMASRVAYAATLALVGRVSLGPTPSVNRRRGKSLARPIGLGVMVVLLMVGISFLGLASGVFEALYQLLAVAAVVIAAWLTWRLADDFGGYLYHRTEQTPGYADEIAASMAIGTVKLVIAIVGLIVAADIADLPYEGVLAGLGVGGVALAFAARETVSNMLAGALLMADRPFKRGHLLETHGELAVVETVGLRSTRLKRLDDTLMVIPNSQLSDQPLVNWGVRHRRRLDLPISVTYDTPRDKLDAFVQQLRRTALEQPRASAEDCFVGVAAFGPSSIDIECRVFVKVYSYEAQVSARHRLICDVIELAKHMDVEFAFPTRTLHIKPPDNVEATVDDSFNSGKEPAEDT